MSIPHTGIMLYMFLFVVFRNCIINETPNLTPTSWCKQLNIRHSVQSIQCKRRLYASAFLQRYFQFQLNLEFKHVQDGQVDIWTMICNQYILMFLTLKIPKITTWSFFQCFLNILRSIVVCFWPFNNFLGGILGQGNNLWTLFCSICCSWHGKMQK